MEERLVGFGGVMESDMAKKDCDDLEGKGNMKRL